MVTRWGSSDITDLHGALVAFSWSRQTDLKFSLTDKCFSCGISLWFFQDFQVGYHQILSFLFNQGKYSGTHSSPPAVVTAASLFPSLCKHHLEKIKRPTVSCLLADPQETHVSYTLWTIEWQKYWCASVPCLGPLDNCPTGHIHTKDIRKLDSKTYLSEKWDTTLSSF